MVTAVFNCGDYAETKEIWQWDYGQVLRIQGLSLPTATEIHFALQEAGGESVTRIGVTKDGVTDVTIPDSLLENDGTSQRYSIYAFIYLADTNSGQTIKKITIPVKSRPKPQAFDKPEDAQLFRDAIKAVNDAADRAGTSEKLAEGWAHGREDMPERAQDNAMYYAGKASEDARQTAADRETVKEMVDSVSDIEQQVETIKGYADQAAKSQESSEGAAKAAGDSAAAAELSGRQAGQYAADAAESASDASDSADQASSHATKAGQAYTSTVELAGRVQTVITQTGEDQVQAINTAGTTQVQMVKSEGAKQVQAVQDAAQEIAADREQIKTNKEDIATLKSDKVDKDQGVDNAGKVLGIGGDGQVTPVEMGGGDVTIDQLLPLAIKATSDKAEMLKITDSADFKMQGFNLYGRTEQVQTEGYNLWPMFKDAELSGVKLTANKDGSVTLNGTCTRSDLFYMIIPVYPMAYTLSCDYTGVLPQNENVRCQIYAPDNTPGETSIRNDAKPDKKAVVTFEKYSEAYFRIRIEDGHTYNNVTMWPMLYYGVDTKPFEPYTGGFPSPRPQMRSRNLFDLQMFTPGRYVEIDFENGTVMYNAWSLGVVVDQDVVRSLFPLGSTRTIKYSAKKIKGVEDEGYTSSSKKIGFYLYNNTNHTVIASFDSNEDVDSIYISATVTIGEDVYTESDALYICACTRRYTKDGSPDKYETWEFTDIMISYIIPEWPQEIANAGKLNEGTGKYEVQVKLTGKNLFDISKNPYKYDEYKLLIPNEKSGEVNITDGIKFEEKTAYYVSWESYKITNPVDNWSIICEFKYTDGSHDQYYVSSRPTGIKSNGAKTIDYIYIANPWGVGMEINSIQIEKGDKRTEYEPYKEQSITLTSDRPLTKWDYLDRRDGVWGWVYKGNIIVLDGSEDEKWDINSDIGENGFSFMYLNSKYNTILCDRLLSFSGNWKDLPYGSIKEASHVIGLRISDVKTVTELRAWLSKNILTVWHEIDAQEFHTLPQDQQDAMRVLTTYYPTTIITNNVNAQMQAQYVADPANYIANHYISKEDTQDIMQRISNIETAMLKL